MKYTPNSGYIFYMISKNYFWGCAVLGMHDAIVSTTGLVVGLVFADAHQYVILLTGVIAAVAAGLSMTASEYLANRAADTSDIALRCGIATGVSYVFTAAMILMPFVFVTNSFVAMGLSYFVAVSIIFFFNYVKSRLSHTKFWPSFLEMFFICFGVTLVAFLIGEGAKLFLGIEI